jgi:hypothetical protein
MEQNQRRSAKQEADKEIYQACSRRGPGPRPGIYICRRASELSALQLSRAGTLHAQYNMARLSGDAGTVESRGPSACVQRAPGGDRTREAHAGRTPGRGRSTMPRCVVGGRWSRFKLQFRRGLRRGAGSARDAQGEDLAVSTQPTSASIGHSARNQPPGVVARRGARKVPMPRQGTRPQSRRDVKTPDIRARSLGPRTPGHDPMNPLRTPPARPPPHAEAE